MQLPLGATVAVADGEKLHLYRNTSDGAHPKLEALPAATIGGDNKGSGGRHHSSAANPDASQIEEDGFTAGVASYLNREVLSGQILALAVIAAPKTLGELRKHYHKQLSAVLVGEVAKDLTGHSPNDIEKAIAAG